MLDDRRVVSGIVGGAGAGRRGALAESLLWQPPGVDAALMIDLASLFREALEG